MKKYTIIIWVLLIFYSNRTFPQGFTITCLKQVFHNGESPSIFLFGVDNLFQENPFFQNIELKKTKDSSWKTEIQIVKPLFFQLEGAQILALPNQKLVGFLQNYNQHFITKDTNNINYVLENTITKIQTITIRYHKGSTFLQFVNDYDSLKHYIDSLMNRLVTPYAKQKYTLTNEALYALRQYFTAELAHFLVLPILYRNNYTDKLATLIQNDIKIGQTSYWLGTQPGRIFLKTFFAEYLLPKFSYDLNKSLAFNNFFLNNDIKKYVTFLYFDQALNKQEDLVSLNEIRKNFATYQNTYSFTKEEKKSLRSIKEKMTAKNKNIAQLFVKQKLLNIEGKELNNAQKENLLKNFDAVIIDYWASWCVPCVEKISQLKSDEVILNGKKYKMIFISIDNNQQSWLESKYPVLNRNNSFRITDIKKASFYTFFEIITIPRLFLVENYLLKSENFFY